ncbi:Multifunctional CCA protein [Buchnera aphidicola (Eriosoma grossulariae)]|uniref:tRNA CCA-pyrophosphorylase n=1 Tax=Buchnera aphidicola TaxID=9 RepID=UPI0034644FB8
MEIYLVGGAVRDSLLNLPIKDKDWVVVGATIEILLKLNFQQVGKEFPVFLHPVSHEEYALARTEYKSGKGYYGFKTNFSPEVTLYDDLMRRDLTINAIAKNMFGDFIDPYFGRLDLKNRILRHVSPAFVDDPLRVLRVARFAATLSHLGFSIAEETLLLMESIVKKRELLFLQSNRIWKETEKALITNNPHVYFQVLYACNALMIIFPEINQLFNVGMFHFLSDIIVLNIDLFKHVSLVSKKTTDLDVRFSCLFQCIYFKNNVINLFDENKNLYIYNYILLIKKFFKRFNIPIYIRDLVLLIIKYHSFMINIIYFNSYDIVLFLSKIDSWRKPIRIKKLSVLINSYCKLNVNNRSKNILPGDFLTIAYSITSTISAKSILHLGLKGIQIRNELIRLRSIKLNLWRKQFLLK